MVKEKRSATGKPRENTDRAASHLKYLPAQENQQHLSGDWLRIGCRPQLINAALNLVLTSCSSVARRDALSPPSTRSWIAEISATYTRWQAIVNSNSARPPMESPSHNPRPRSWKIHTRMVPDIRKKKKSMSMLKQA